VVTADEQLNSSGGVQLQALEPPLDVPDAPLQLGGGRPELEPAERGLPQARSLARCGRNVGQLAAGKLLETPDAFLDALKPSSEFADLIDSDPHPP
jgi:hypothetical protein